MYKRKRYPPNWRQLSFECKKRAGWKCEICGIRQCDTCISKRTGAEYVVYLHAAHMQENDTENTQPELKALCPKHHGILDAKRRRRAKRIALEKLKHRKLLEQRQIAVLSAPT